MMAALRHLAFVPESLLYGPTFGYLQHTIRSSKPLDPKATWNQLTRPLPAVTNWIRTHYPPAFARQALVWAKERQDHVLGISAHYDVSNEFYELFLDRKYMFYSCADFHRDDETLEEAQTHKANFILNLIDPKPGQKILELGCGWGAMLKRIEEATGDRQNLYGYTLSQEQVAYNEQHNHYNVEFRNFVTTDYPENTFDAIYSIGAWEHVRAREIPQLLTKLHRALKPGGKLVKHFFCRFENALAAAGVAAQIFFPGSTNASLKYHLQAFQAAGFRIQHRSLHDYRPTLRAWFDNLAANRERAIEIVGVPTYNKYMVFFPASWRYFDDVTGMVIRLVMEKQA